MGNERGCQEEKIDFSKKTEQIAEEKLSSQTYYKRAEFMVY